MVGIASATLLDVLSEGKIRADLFAIAVLVVLALGLFRLEFDGRLWIGNPDRLNSDLKVMQHYLADGGAIQAWNEHEMMGYDSFALPYTYPNPLVALLRLLGPAAAFVAMGYVVIAMMAAAGIAAYGFIRAYVPPGLPALTGAICYEFSALTILKASQNSMSFAVFIVFPLMAWCIGSTRRETAPSRFAGLGVLLSMMLGFMFLQKAAYVLLVLGAFALWRGWRQRSWWPIGVFGGALGAALLFAWPRIAGIGTAISQYTRVIPGLDFRNFDDLYRFQNILPYEFYRWFDDTLFGRSPSDAVGIGNNINLTEGFLIYTSAVVPLLLAVAVLGWLGLRVKRGGAHSDMPFFAVILTLCILVVVWKPAANAVYLLFLRVDFTHARILMAALLPLAVLVAGALAGLRPSPPQGEAPARFIAWTTVAGVALALVANVLIEHAARRHPGWSEAVDMPKVRDAAVFRIQTSLALAAGALALLLPSFRLPVRRVAHASLCAFIAIQCLIGANGRVNGRQVFDLARPFFKGDMYYADQREFQRPTDTQRRILHQRLESDAYRVVLVCDPTLADGFCGGHVPEFWQLRAIDGYYGLGVPARLRALPWPTGVSLRSISFSRVDQLPWELLGFLNVNAALVVGDGTYRNITRDAGVISPYPDPAAFRVVSSPARVTPRAFFARAIGAVADADDAVRRIFRPDGITDPTTTSFVEGLSTSREFGVGGAVRVDGVGDHLQLRFASSDAERFLVLNELYYPGWRAESAGRRLPVYATNAVMRGVVVPGGADRVDFYYAAPSATPAAQAMRYSAGVLVIAGLLLLRRWTARPAGARA
jgi:hypothetical protein